MPLKRIVILPTRSKSAFGRIEMPNGDDALVLNESVHRRALAIADKKLKKTLKIRKSGANVGGKGQAA
jgi:hypothetical protein